MTIYSKYDHRSKLFTAVSETINAKYTFICAIVIINIIITIIIRNSGIYIYISRGWRDASVVEVLACKYEDHKKPGTAECICNPDTGG